MRERFVETPDAWRLALELTLAHISLEHIPHPTHTHPPTHTFQTQEMIRKLKEEKRWHVETA